MNKDSILSVENLTVAFGQKRVVDGLSYTLSRGKTLGLVGESGSGKSMSSLALMGLLPKGATTSGSAFLRGRNLLCLSEAELQPLRGHSLSMIFQEPMTSLNPVQRCGEQVLEVLGAGRSMEGGRERVLELFNEVLLPRPEKIYSAYPHELSGGQKQRVMIAMALIGEPDLLIADEPTTALDVTVQKNILRLLRDLQQRHGTSILFITHDLGVIAEVADEVLVMYRGRTVEQAPTSQLLHHPAAPYTRGLLACRPPLEGHPHRLPTVEQFLHGEAEEMADLLPSEPSPSPSQQPLFQVRDLRVSYTLKKSLLGRPLQVLNAVDGVSFDILRGETLGLVGESGCGKSTLGRALLRLVPSTGSLRLFPSDSTTPSAPHRHQQPLELTALGEREMRPLRSRLQLIFQDPYSSLNPRLTIGQAIEEPLRHLKADRRAASVSEMMEAVGLDPAWHSRYPHQLSGGQRQRVCIARALIQQPEFVICDESVSALDVSIQAQVLNLLNDLKDRFHYTYLFITHDLSVVHYMADRILVMQRGSIVESGTPDELFLRPQTDYTRTLLDAIPRIE